MADESKEAVLGTLAPSPRRLPAARRSLRSATRTQPRGLICWAT